MSQENETILLDDRNLVAEFLLNGDANDTSGNGYHGTATNVVYTKTDRDYQSQCGVFNGSSSYMNATLPSQTVNGAQFVSFNVRRLGNGNGTYNGLVQFQDGASIARFALWIGPSNVLYVFNSDGVFQSTGYTLQLLKDTHIVFGRTGSQMKLYVDGESVYTVASSGNDGANPINYIRLGCRENYAEFSNVNIQTVRIFNAALSEKEIRNRYLHSLRMAGGSSLATLSDGIVSYLESSDGNELSDIVGGKDGTKVSGTATTDNLGNTRAITNPNYTFPSITYANVYSYENSGGGWGLVANPVGISATALNRTTTFRLALFFNRALSASEQTAWAEILSKRYVLPFDVDGRKGLPRQLKENCKLWLSGDVNGTTAFDASGNGNHGTLVGSPTPKRRQGYKGFTLNGSNQYVVANIPSMTGSFSISLNVRSANMNGGSGVMVGMVRTSPSENTEHYLFAGNGTDSMRCAFVAYDGAFITVQASPRLNTSSTYRIRIAFDSATKKMSLYVNGRLNGSFTTANQLTAFNRIYVGLARPPYEYCQMDWMNFVYEDADKGAQGAMIDFINFFIPSP